MRKTREPAPEPPHESVLAHEFVAQAYRTYGQYVVAHRAVADYRDGLKPVQRRILWAMHGLGLRPGRDFAKAARTVGETIGRYHPHGDCLDGDTLVYSLAGDMHRIADLALKPDAVLHVLAYDERAERTVPAIARAFRVGQQATKIYNVTLSDGTCVRTTNNHPFFVKNHGWVRAEDLTIGMSLFGGELTQGSYLACKIGKQVGPVHKLVASVIDQRPGMIVHHKNENKYDNRPSNLAWLTRGEHAVEHLGEESYDELRQGRATMFSEDGPIREAIRKKNSILLGGFNKTAPVRKALKILDLVRNDGHVPTRELYAVYRERVYNGTTIERLESQGYTFDQLCRMTTEDLSLGYRKQASGLTEPYRKKHTAKPMHCAESVQRARYLSEFAAIAVPLFEQQALDVTWADYNKARVDQIQKTGLGYGNISGRSYAKSETLKRLFGENVWDVVRAASPKHMLVIERLDVEVFETPRPMYDFTVDGCENMFVPIKRADGNFTLVLLHNSGCYDALVGMTAARYPLIDGQGNFGTPSGDPAADMRYTEARLSGLAASMIGQDPSILTLVPTFDGRAQEPVWFASELPFILMNGSSGIAVGIVTCIPPHRLVDLLAGLRALIQDADAVIDGLVPGPDYGTGVLTSGPAQVAELYRTGEGALEYRCRYHEEPTGQQHRLVVTDLAPNFGVERFLAAMAKLREAGTIADVDDESSAHGIRIVVTGPLAALRQYGVPALATTVQYRFYCNEGAADGSARTFRTDLRDLLVRWLAFRRATIADLLAADLARLQAELARLEAHVLAAKNVKTIARVLGEGPDDLEAALALALGCTAAQAAHIATVPIGRLVRRAVEAVQRDLDAALVRRTAVERDIRDPDRVLLAGLAAVEAQYGGPRGTGLAGDRTWVQRGAALGRVLAASVRADDLVVAAVDTDVVTAVWADGTEERGPVIDLARRSRARPLQETR